MAESVKTISVAEDADLVSRAKRKDEAAVRSLIQRYNRRLFRLARGIVRDDSEAEDVVQEAYVRAFTRLAEFRGESAFGTWLGRIVLNEALGRVRRRRRAAGWVSIDALEPNGRIIPFPLTSKQPDPERTMAQHEIRTVLERAIDDLPEAFRAVLVARLIEEMSVEDTAAVFGLRPETVKTRLHRARRLLQHALEKQIGPVLTDAFPFDGARCRRVADAVVGHLGLQS